MWMHPTVLRRRYAHNHGYDGGERMTVCNPWSAFADAFGPRRVRLPRQSL